MDCGCTGKRSVGTAQRRRREKRGIWVRSESKQWRKIKPKPVSLVSQMVETRAHLRREHRVCFYGCPRRRGRMQHVNCGSLKDFSLSDAPLIASLWENCDVKASEVRQSATDSFWPQNQSVLLIMQTAVCSIKLLFVSESQRNRPLTVWGGRTEQEGHWFSSDLQPLCLQ